MRRFKGADAAGLGNEKAKLRGMVFLFVLVLAAIVGAQFTGDDDADELVDALPAGPAGADAAVQLPNYPPGTWEAFEDATPEQRLVLEPGPLEVLAAIAGNLTASQFEALELRPLDAAAVAELEADPAARRGDAFSARGEVLRLDASPGLGVANDRVLGTLELADGARAHFVALRRADPPLAVGDFVRLDGLFVKRFRDELGASGEWVDAPLLVGPRAVRSARDYGTVAELPAGFWTGVEDDLLASELPPDRQGLPEEQKWRLLAWLRDAPEGTFDWENAQTLSAELLEVMARGGDVFRGEPFLLPISIAMDVRERRAPENPARLDHVTEAWVGNQGWSARAAAVYVLLPGQRQDGIDGPARLRGPESEGDLVTGRLVYWKNIAFTTNDGVRRLAPVFLGVELEEFVPPRDDTLIALAIVFAGFTILFAVWLFVMVKRDKRKSAELERKLVERRRARREKLATQQG